jgi:N-acetylneuraminic acid mutarotase
VSISIIFVLSAFLFLFQGISFADIGSWSSKAPMPAAAVVFGSAVIDGKIYVAGGYLSPYTDALNVYDPNTDTWTAKAKLPVAVGYTAAVSLNGKLYVVGGQNSTGILNSVYQYDPSTDTWTSLAPMPTKRSALGLVVSNGEIYAMGGFIDTNNTATNIVEVYDPITNTWSTKTSMPSNKGYIALAESNGSIYSFGGYDRAISLQHPELNYVEEYDPATDTWTTKNPLAVKQYGMSATTVNDQIYVIGGVNTSYFYQYDPKSDSWTNLPSMITKHASGGLAYTNNSLYAFGGNSGSGYTNTVEAYGLAVSTPVAPLNLSATGGDSSVDLSWTASTDATSYNLFCSTTTGGPYSQIATSVTSTTYSDTTVSNGTTYYYVATAVNSGGESGYSNEANATPTAPTSNDRAILVITLVSGLEKEYDLSMTEVNAFTTWYAGQAPSSNQVYTFNKTYNLAKYSSRKDYIAYDKIETFEVNEYTP